MRSSTTRYASAQTGLLESKLNQDTAIRSRGKTPLISLIIPKKTAGRSAEIAETLGLGNNGRKITAKPAAVFAVKNSENSKFPVQRFPNDSIFFCCRDDQFSQYNVNTAIS
jgi:hypothetical protein